MEIDVDNTILDEREIGIINESQEDICTVISTEKIYYDNNCEIHYNLQAYISISPSNQWSGCSYIDFTGMDIPSTEMVDAGLTAMLNLQGVGVFNAADAGVTMNCIYDPVNQRYKIQYIYYLIDFYDFSFEEILHQQDAYGKARGYELYGWCLGEFMWNKGESVIFEYDSMSVSDMEDATGWEKW